MPLLVQCMLTYKNLAVFRWEPPQLAKGDTAPGSLIEEPVNAGRNFPRFRDIHFK